MEYNPYTQTFLLLIRYGNTNATDPGEKEWVMEKICEVDMLGQLQWSWEVAEHFKHRNPKVASQCAYVCTAVSYMLSNTCM
jgi:hypothetical protein